jgi:hypothetical protein
MICIYVYLYVLIKIHDSITVQNTLTIFIMNMKLAGRMEKAYTIKKLDCESKIAIII